LGFFMGVYRSYQIDNSMFEISEIFFNCGVWGSLNTLCRSQIGLHRGSLTPPKP
jgi:hypothetical protein